jgi:hypothetical protein
MCYGGNLHKNNPFIKEKHRLTFRRNYFTHLTVLCDAPLIGATPHWVAPMRATPLTRPTWRGRR